MTAAFSLSNMPRRTHSSAYHPIRRVVFENVFALGIPANRPAQYHCDIAQMAGDCRAMPHLDRCNCCRAGFDAVEKIPPMPLTMVPCGLGKVNLIGAYYFFDEILRLGFQSASRYMHPAVFADKPNSLG